MRDEADVIVVGSGMNSLVCAGLLARRGKRVLACEVNADDRLSALFGCAPVGPRIVEVRENLWCVNVRPHEASASPTAPVPSSTSPA